MPADQEIGEHGTAHAAAAVDEVSGSAHAESQGAVEPVHFDDGLVLIGEQHVRQAVPFAKPTVYM